VPGRIPDREDDPVVMVDDFVHEPDRPPPRWMVLSALICCVITMVMGIVFSVHPRLLFPRTAISDGR
jgi:hypothetical protein